MLWFRDGFYVIWLSDDSKHFHIIQLLIINMGC